MRQQRCIIGVEIINVIQVYVWTLNNYNVNICARIYKKCNKDGWNKHIHSMHISDIEIKTNTKVLLDRT